MKHAVNQKKKVSPLPRKSFSEPKKSVVKATKNIAEQTLKPNSVKTISIKSKSAVAAKNTKLKTVAPKKQVVAQPIKKAERVKKKVSAVMETKAVASKKDIKSNSKKIAPRATEKTVKVVARKTKPTVTVKQKTSAKTVAPKTKLKTAKTIEKPTTQKNASKVTAAKTSKKNASAQIKNIKIQTAKAKNPTAKGEKVKTANPKENTEKVQKKTLVAAKKKIVEPKTKTPVINKKLDQKSPKSKLKAVGKVVRKNPETKPQGSIKISKQPSKQAKQIAAETKIQPKAVKIKTPVVPKISKTAAKKVKEEKSIKIRNGRLVLPPREKVKADEVPVKAAVEPLETSVSKPRRRKLKTFGSAVFRGKKEHYGFQVFPVDGEFEDSAAVFIISRRVVDRFERAHHRMVCIGQTASVLKELKKHSKGKCFKQHQVNAISVLREENEQKRLKIEADLKSAHRIPCPHS